MFKKVVQSSCYGAKKHTSAFSLVEMLTALLVASLLMAALAPVMTRKMDENVHVSGTSKATNNGNETHGVKIFEYDALNDSDKEFSKHSFLVPQGVHTISLVLQAGGGGGGGSTSGYTSYNNMLDTTNTSSNTITIEGNLVGIKNVRLDLTGGGAGGGGGKAPVVDCKEPNFHKYINSTQGNGTQQCVTKFNVGDNGGPPVAVGSIKCVQFDSSYKAACTPCGDTTNANYGKCYYIGKYTDCTDDPMGGGYSGCGRTVMQWHAANNSCNAYTGAGLAKGKWRLPKAADISKWNAYSSVLNSGQGSNGLQLCVWSAESSVANKLAYCGWNQPNTQGCYGSFGDDCDGDDVWLGDIVETNGRGTFCPPSLKPTLQTGTQGSGWVHNGSSARCLTTDNSAFTYAYKTGGGGGSGARVYNYTLPEEYNGKKLLEIGNRITILRGNFGGGGTAGVNGANGSPSCVNVYDKNGVSLFYFCANGGYLGKAPTETKYGDAGTSNATCRIGVSSASYQNVNCSNYGTTISQGGSNGTSNTVNYNASVSGGNGGKSTFNTNLAGGVGGTVSSADGKIPSASGNNIPYGAGGGGGSSTTTTAGAGGNGYIGYAKITYDIERTGGSGGGGGGGSMSAVASLEVEEGKTYEIITGKGGKGGSVNNNGTDGHFSSFKYSDTKTIKANGGKAGNAGDHNGIYGTGGEGGKGGSKINLSIGYGISTAEGKDGGNGYDYDISKVKKSIGGNGGASGIGSDGGCGGLSFYYSDSSYAETDKTEGSSGNSSGSSSSGSTNSCRTTNTTADSGLYLLNTLIMGTDYGKAGSGGGGGGFESYSLYGTGGNGGNGYVFVKW